MFNIINITEINTGFVILLIRLKRFACILSYTCLTRVPCSNDTRQTWYLFRETGAITKTSTHTHMEMFKVSNMIQGWCWMWLNAIYWVLLSKQYPSSSNSKVFSKSLLTNCGRITLFIDVSLYTRVFSIKSSLTWSLSVTSFFKTHFLLCTFKLSLREKCLQHISHFKYELKWFFSPHTCLTTLSDRLKCLWHLWHWKSSRFGLWDK